MKATPKVSTQAPRRRSSASPASPTLSSRRHAGAPAKVACGADVARALSCQRAVNPVSPTLRSSGSKRPPNEGCGQSDASVTRVLAPTGAKARSPVPTSSRPTSAWSGRRAPANASATSARKPRGWAAWPVPASTGTTTPSICTTALRTPRESPRATKSVGASHCKREPACCACGTSARPSFARAPARRASAPTPGSPRRCARLRAIDRRAPRRRRSPIPGRGRARRARPRASDLPIRGKRRELAMGVPCSRVCAESWAPPRTIAPLREGNSKPV